MIVAIRSFLVTLTKHPNKSSSSVGINVAGDVLCVCSCHAFSTARLLRKLIVATWLIPHGGQQIEYQVLLLRSLTPTTNIE